MDVNLMGLIRGLNPFNYAEGDLQELSLNSRGEALIAQALPANAAIVALGRSWQLKVTTGIAALTALPTTTAGLSLYNGEAPSGSAPAVCYFIEEFGSDEEVIDATQADTTNIMAMMNKKTNIVTVPTDSGLVAQSLSGRTYDGLAKTVTSATVVNDGWYGHGPQSPLAPAVAAANWKHNECKVLGLYMVPPGGQFNIIAVKAAAAAALQQFYFIRWHEVLMHYKA